jgi:hypothetical protein
MDRARDWFWRSIIIVFLPPLLRLRATIEFALDGVEDLLAMPVDLSDAVRARLVQRLLFIETGLHMLLTLRVQGLTSMPMRWRHRLQALSRGYADTAPERAHITWVFDHLDQLAAEHRARAPAAAQVAGTQDHAPPCAPFQRLAPPVYTSLHQVCEERGSANRSTEAREPGAALRPLMPINRSTPTPRSMRCRLPPAALRAFGRQLPRVVAVERRSSAALNPL